MIVEQGTVIFVNGEVALVAIQQNKTCAQCASNLGCGMGLFSGLVGQKCARISLDNSIGANVGDQVTIGVPEKSLLQLTAITYLLPLLIMLSAGLLLELLLSRDYEGAITIIALFGFALGLFLSNFVSKKMNLNLSLHPKVIAITQQCIS